MGDKNLGARLRAAREKTGLKPTAVCAAVDLPSVQTLTAYEEGIALPSNETLVRLASLYDVAVNELLMDITEEQLAKKRKAASIRQLVEAATALNLGFVIREDPHSHTKTYAISTSTIEVRDFYLFLEKWSILCQLRNDDIISQDEYTKVVLDRLDELNIG